MPELPDVEVFREYLQSTSLRQPIKNVASVDKKILWKTSPHKIRSALKGNQIRACSRHGKYLFAELKSGDSLGMHFGMSGGLEYFKEGDEPPAHTRMLVQFQNGHHLAYVCVRKLGKVFVAKDAESFVRSRKLGPDALAIDLDTFHSIFRNRKGAVKPALMDQGAVAGLGNVYTDEILFQAGIRPTRRCDDLNSRDWQHVFRVMRKVLPTAIKKKAQPDRFPKSYLTPHRHPQSRCPRCGKRLENKRVGGRTTYFCPRDQK